MGLTHHNEGGTSGPDMPGAVAAPRTVVGPTCAADAEGMLVRIATTSDEALAYDLVCELEQTRLDREGFSRAWRAQRAGDGFVCLIAYEAGEGDAGTDATLAPEPDASADAELALPADGRVLGMLNLRLEWQLHHAARIAEVMELVVVPEARSRGVGALLFRTACEHARADGCVQVEVACNKLREGAHRFYAREGMRNFHDKLTMPLSGEAPTDNRLGI